MFSKIIDNIPCGIWIIEIKTRRVLEVNAAVCALLGVPRESIIGQPCHAFLCHRGTEQCPVLDGNETLDNNKHTMRDAFGACFSVIKSAVRIRYRATDCLMETFVDLRREKTNEQALAESESNFRTFFETLDDLIFIASPQGHIYYTNSVVTKKLGFAASELENMHVLDVHPPEYRAEAENIYAAMFRGERATCPLPLRKKNGDWLQVETRTWMGRWDGKDCIYGLVKDMTQQNAALEKFEKVFQNNPAMMAINKYKDRSFVDINTAFLERLGYTREEVIGRTAAELDLFPQPAAHLEVSQQLFQVGKIKNVELKVKTKAGDILEGLFSGEMIDNQGDISVLTVAIDISEIRKLQRELKASEELRHTRDFLENLIELASAPVIVWDAQLHITKFNRAAERLTGLVADSVLGASVTSLIPQDMQTLAQSIFAEILCGRQLESVEIPIRRVTGEERIVLWSTAILYEADGRTIKATIAQGQDITERKRMEERLNERSTDLEKVNQLLRAEIRQHKTTQKRLRSLSTTLAKTEESERRRIAMDLHDHIIQTLIYANISLSRIRDHATDRMATETVEEVYQCLQQSIQALRTLTFEISSPVLYELGFIPAVAWLVRQFQEKHHLQISFDHTVSIEVSEQIGGLLFQAVRELLTNVVKHAQATHVLVHVAQKHRLLKIVVEDDGIGLGRAGLGVDADRSSGFGMFNIRERIGSLKGTMKVVSAPAKGTRVELTLPYASRSSHAQGTL